MNDTTPFDDQPVDETLHEAADSDLTAAFEATEEYEAAPAAEETRTSGFHPVSVGHLVMGVAFAGILVIWALYVTGTTDSDDLRWLVPLPWLGAGVAGLIALVLAPRRRARQTTY